MAPVLEFYTVFVPKINALKMRLCDAFVAKLKPWVPPEKVLLRNGAGEEFDAEVLKEDGEIYFDKGWPQFVEANGLEAGFFLFFRYDGVGTFDVKIYDYSACEKYNSVDSSDDDEDGSGGDDEDESDSDYGVPCNSRKNKGLEERGGPSQRRPYPKLERFDSDAELLVKQGNLYFVARRGSGKRENQLAIPGFPLRDMNVKLDDTVVYRDPLGREYAGKISKWKTGQRWINGWKSFCELNHLSATDKCIFELFQDKDGKCSKMLVHIIRK